MGSAGDGASAGRARVSFEQAMVETISRAAPQSGAEALKELRSAFPETPLAQRVAALVKLARQQNGPDASQR
jgi:hypothetical protein